MIYPKIQGSRVSEKNISAFYGVNRTAKINDFQLSEMKNMDCEAFPFVATRKSREMIYPLKTETQSAMRLICGDTDLEDDYLVTGITQDGKFLYREKEVSFDSGGAKTIERLKKAEFMMEYMGDYVLFPGMDAVTIRTEMENGEPRYIAEMNTATVAKPFEKSFDGSTSYTIGSNPFVVGKNEIVVNVQVNNRGKLIGAPPCMVFEERFAAGDFYSGLSFRLKLFCRYGVNVTDIDNEYVCNIPEDVFMVMDKVYFVDKNENEIFYDPDKLEPGQYSFHIDFTAYQIVNGEMNRYDISQHFVESLLKLEKRDAFWAGVVHANPMDTNFRYWNDVYIDFINPPMVFGAAFGGRLFGCDTAGVSIYYSSGAAKQYLFYPGTGAGDAGAVLSADPGKWTALKAFGGALYAFKRDAMYRIYSSDGLAFYIERVADVGATGKEAVCVVDNVMYFLSSNGLYAFSGSYPQPLPDSLGRTYLSGVLGGNVGKLFCSLVWKENEIEKRELCVYHIDKGIFSVHDEFAVSQFVWFGGELYALEEDCGVVWRMERVREAVEFSFDTKQYFFSFQKKAVSAARIYFEFDPAVLGGYFEILVSEDNGEFVLAAPPIASGRVRYVPVKFRKCDEFRIRICGKGIFTLKGISFALYQGGDVKQN